MYEYPTYLPHSVCVYESESTHKHAQSNKSENLLKDVSKGSSSKLYLKERTKKRKEVFFILTR